jgi:hypothetical protein
MNELDSNFIESSHARERKPPTVDELQCVGVALAR